MNYNKVNYNNTLPRLAHPRQLLLGLVSRPPKDEPTPSQNTAFQEICPAGEKTTAPPPLKIPAKVSVHELCGENTAHSTERQLNRLLQRGRGLLCSG